MSGRQRRLITPGGERERKAMEKKKSEDGG